jgi:flagellar basal-body rod protein FlgB
MAANVTNIDHLEAALKGGSIRQATIANNIANLATPGYRRVAVAFEERLAKAIADGKKVDLNELAKDVIRPKTTPVDANGNDVTLEMEVGEMIKNVGMQKTYLRLLAKTYRKMESAMSLR